MLNLPAMRPSPFLLLAALFVSPASSTLLSQDAKPASPLAESKPSEVTLPHSGMVFVSDTTRQGRVLVQLHATEIMSNSHAAGNLARSMVYVGARSSVELNGLSAATTLEGNTPTFYVRINGDDPDLLKGRVHLLRLRQTTDRRVVASYSQNIFGGQRAKKFEDVPIVKAEYEPDVWLKVTTQAPLAPGEYGIVFMPKDTNLAPDSVYDFDTPAAPK